MKIIIAEPSAAAARLIHLFSQRIGETSSAVCLFFIEPVEVVLLLATNRINDVAPQLRVKMVFDLYVMLVADVNQTIEDAEVAFVKNVGP